MPNTHSADSSEEATTKKRGVHSNSARNVSFMLSFIRRKIFMMLKLLTKKTVTILDFDLLFDVNEKYIQIHVGRDTL